MAIRLHPLPLMCVLGVLTAPAELRGECEIDEIQTFVAPSSLAGDQLGSAVAVDGDTAVAGAPQRLHPAGCSEPYCDPPRGAIFVVVRDATGAWTEQALVFASEVEAGYEGFGAAVDIDGDIIVVGAPRYDQSGLNAGAVYIYERDLGGPGTWGEVAVLYASDASSGDWFGGSVAIDGDTLIVGAHFNDEGGTEAGAAYVFHRDQDDWVQVARLSASDATAYQWFGADVALDGDTAIVGAPYWWFSGIGAAYIFQRDEGGPGSWGEVTRFTASDAGPEDIFGSAVAISGDIAVVGMGLADSDAGFNSGKAYIFQQHLSEPNQWLQRSAISPPQPQQEGWRRRGDPWRRRDRG